MSTKKTNILPNLNFDDSDNKLPELEFDDVKKKEPTVESFEEFQTSMEGVSTAPTELDSEAPSTTKEEPKITDAYLKNNVYRKLDYLGDVYNYSLSLKEQKAFENAFPMFEAEKTEIEKRMQSGDETAFADYADFNKRLMQYRDSYAEYFNQSKPNEIEVTANNLLKQAHEMRGTYEELQGKNIAQQLATGIGEGVGDYLRDYASILTTLKDNKNIKELNNKLEQLNKGQDVDITKDEELLFNALQVNTEMAMAMDELLPSSYKIGEAVGQSLGFMGEFMLTAGIGKGVGIAIKGAAKGASKGTQISAKLASWAARTGIQAGSMPSFYKESAKKIAATGEVGNSLWDAYSDQLIEVGSERIFMGQLGSGQAKNAAMRVLQRTGSAVANAKGWKQLTLGVGEEMLEEKIADLFHGIKQYDNIDDFWNNYIDVERNLEMMASVGIITGVLGTANVGIQQRQKKKVSNKLNLLIKELPSSVISHIDNRMEMENVSPKDVMTSLKDVIQLEVENDNMSKEEGAYNAVRSLAYVSTKLQQQQLQGSTADFEKQMEELESTAMQKKEAAAEAELKKEADASYKLGDKVFEDKDTFLESVAEIENVEEMPSMAINNDPTTANEVKLILEEKVGKDKAQEIASSKLSEAVESTQKTPEGETTTEKKDAVKKAEIKPKDKEIKDAKEGTQVRQEAPKEGVQQEQRLGDMPQQSKQERIKEEEKAEPKKYESKEKFKSDFVSGDKVATESGKEITVAAINLQNIRVTDDTGQVLKQPTKEAAAKNLREGKETKQAKWLSDALDEAFEKGTLDATVLTAGGKSIIEPVPIESIARPQAQLSDVEVYEEYAKERAREKEPLPKEGAQKTMEARDDIVKAIRTTIETDIGVEDLDLENFSPGEAAKAAEKITKDKIKKSITAKIKTVNELLKNAKEKKHITTFEQQAIRTKLKDIAEGQDYLYKEAIKYADKVITNADFRAKEKQKIKDIKSIKKELKAVGLQKGKYMARKPAYRTEDAADFVDEYSSLTENELMDMPAESVANVLETIKETKKELKEKASVKKEERKKKLKEYEQEARASITPIRKGKRAKAQEEYIEYGKKEARPNWVQRYTDIVRQSVSTWDANLTSFISRLDALSSAGEGKVGSEHLNKRFYHDMLLRGEKDYKLFRSELGENTLDAIKKIYGKKDARDVLNDHSVEFVEIPFQRTKKDILGKTQLIQDKREISRGEAIKWHMLLQDPTLQNRIFEPWRTNEKGRVTGNGFTTETVKAIDNYLTAKDKQYADFLFSQYQQLRERYNPFMREKYAVNLPTNDFYSNIYSEYYSDQISTNPVDMLGNSPQGTLKANNVIARVRNREQIKDMDATTAFFDYVDKMEWMNQMTDPLEVYRAMFKSDKNLRAIKTYYGQEAADLVNFYEKMIQRDVQDMNQKQIDRFTRHFASAALGINPNITVKQLFSTTMALTEVNPAQFMKEFASLPKEITKALKNKEGFLYDVVSSDAIRTRGDVGLGLDVFMSSYAKKNKFSQNQILNTANKFYKTTQKFWAKNIMLGDKTAASIGGTIVAKTKYNEYKKKGVDGTKARAYALQDASRFIDATQQSMSMFNTSPIRVKSGSLGRVMSAFTSGPAQLARIEMNLWRNIQTGTFNKGQFKKKQVLKNIGRLLVVRQLIPALYQLAADGYEWDGENQKVAALLGNLNGVFIIGKLVEKLKNEMTYKPFDVALLPVIDNMHGMIKTAFDAHLMWRYPERYGERDKERLSERFRAYLGLFVGIPIKSLETIATDGVGEFFEAYETDQQEVAKEAIATKKDVVQILENRYGTDFVWDGADMSDAVKPYMSEYVFQTHEKAFGDYEHFARKIVNTWDYDQKYQLLVSKASKMNVGEMYKMLDILNTQYKVGEHKMRVISDNLMEDVIEGAEARR